MDPKTSLNVSFRIVLYIMGNSGQKVLSMDKNRVSMGISVAAMTMRPMRPDGFWTGHFEYGDLMVI